LTSKRIPSAIQAHATDTLIYGTKQKRMKTVRTGTAIPCQPAVKRRIAICRLLIDLKGSSARSVLQKIKIGTTMVPVTH
jgi:hypothetical protein